MLCQKFKKNYCQMWLQGSHMPFAGPDNATSMKNCKISTAMINTDGFDR